MTTAPVPVCAAPPPRRRARLPDILTAAITALLALAAMAQAADANATRAAWPSQASGGPSGEATDNNPG